MAEKLAQMVSVLTCNGEEEHYLISTRNPVPDEGFRDLTQSVQVNSGTLLHIRIQPLHFLSQFYRAWSTMSIIKKTKKE
jgi:hypothetical protein